MQHISLMLTSCRRHAASCCSNQSALGHLFSRTVLGEPKGNNSLSFLIQPSQDIITRGRDGVDSSGFSFGPKERVPNLFTHLARAYLPCARCVQGKLASEKNLHFCVACLRRFAYCLLRKDPKYMEFSVVINTHTKCL